MTASEPAAPDPPGPDPASRPDPEKGLRGIFAACLVLEAIVVLLALLLPIPGGSPARPVIVVLAGLLIVASGVQRRPWGLPVALGLQVATIAAGLLVPAVGIMGVIFAGVWAFLLHLRREVARRLAG